MTDALIKGSWTSSRCLFLASFCGARWPRTIGRGVGGGDGDGNQKNKAAAPVVGTGCLFNKHRLSWQKAHDCILVASANGLVVNLSFLTGVDQLPLLAFLMFVIVGSLDRWMDG